MRMTIAITFDNSTPSYAFVSLLKSSLNSIHSQPGHHLLVVKRYVREKWSSWHVLMFSQILTHPFTKRTNFPHHRHRHDPKTSNIYKRLYNSSIGTLLAFKDYHTTRSLFAMQIKVRTLTGKEIELDIEPDYKVSRIKERVEEKEGIPPVQQRLIFGGKQMSDDKTAAEYNLEGGATLHLVLALRGGR